MSNLDHLIQTMTADTTPVKPRCPWRLLVAWLVPVLIVLAGYVAIVGVRADVATQLGSPVFIAETVVLFALMVMCGVVAVWLSYPDARQARGVTALPLLGAALYIALIGYRAMQPAAMAAGVDHLSWAGAECAACLTGLAAVTGLWLFYLLRRQATTTPRTAGAAAVLAAAAAGQFALMFIEAGTDVVHLMVWHLVPIIVLTAIGAFVGRKALRW